MMQYVLVAHASKRSELGERGASAVEYGLLVAGIAALALAVVFMFGDVLDDIFTNTCNSIGQSQGVNCNN